MSVILENNPLFSPFLRGTSKVLLKKEDAGGAFQGFYIPVA